MSKFNELIKDEAQEAVNSSLATTLAKVAETFAVAAQSVQVEQPVDLHGAAEFMGVDTQTVRNWLSKPPRPSNPIPYLKAGSGLRFLRSELVVWMRRNAIEAEALPLAS